MTIAGQTRDAARQHPFLLHALRAGVVNYAAAATFLDVDGDTDAVATALRRFAAELPSFSVDDRDARVTMQSGVALVDGEGANGSENLEGDTAEGGGDVVLMSIGGRGVIAGGGSETAVLATGDVGVAALGAVCSRLHMADVDVEAAGVAGETLLVVVGRRDGATAVRLVEEALSTVPG